MMQLDELDDFIKKLAYAGKEYDEIKQRLIDLNLKPEELSTILGKIDDYIIDYQLATQQKSNNVAEMIGGVVFFILGAGITIFSYLSNRGNYVFAYGAILFGAWLFKEGYKKYKLPIEDRVFNKPGKRKGRFDRY
jgi:hypothetical protein